MIKTLAILLLLVFPFFHSWTFHWHPSVALNFHLFLKICFVPYIFSFRNILLTTIIVLIISGFEFCLRFFYQTSVTWAFMMLVERQLYWNKFIIVCLKIFSSVRLTSLHNESDLSFVRFIARANFRRWE